MKHLLLKEVQFEATEIKMVLADGEVSMMNAIVFAVDVVLNHRVIPETLTAVSDFVKSKTFLEIGFICQTNVILDT